MAKRTRLKPVGMRFGAFSTREILGPRPSDDRPMAEHKAWEAAQAAPERWVYGSKRDDRDRVALEGPSVLAGVEPFATPAQALEAFETYFANNAREIQIHPNVPAKIPCKGCGEPTHRGFKILALAPVVACCRNCDPLFSDLCDGIAEFRVGPAPAREG